MSSGLAGLPLCKALHDIGLYPYAAEKPATILPRPSVPSAHSFQPSFATTTSHVGDKPFKR